MNLQEGSDYATTVLDGEPEPLPVRATFFGPKFSADVAELADGWRMFTVHYPIVNQAGQPDVLTASVFAQLDGYRLVNWTTVPPLSLGLKASDLVPQQASQQLPANWAIHAAAEEMYQFILSCVHSGIFRKQHGGWLEGAVNLLDRAKPVQLPG